MKNKPFKYGIIATAIMELIAGGVYAPGDKLPSEAELTRRFNVSRVTLRESLKKLSMMGVVEIRQGHGTFVEEITPAKFMKPLFPFLAFKQHNIDEVYAVRSILESAICELAAEQRDDDDLVTMRAQLQGMEEALCNADLPAFSALDKDFHQAVQHSCKNEILAMFGDLFSQFLHSYLPAINRSAEIAENSLRHHQLIFEAIADRRREMAGLLMREHLLKAKTDLLAIMEEGEAADFFDADDEAKNMLPSAHDW